MTIDSPGMSSQRGLPEPDKEPQAKEVLKDSGNLPNAAIKSVKAGTPIKTPKRLGPQDRTVGVSNLRALLPKKIQENDNLYISIKTLLQFLKGNVTEKGIFRISGNQTEVTRLLKELKSNPKADIKKLTYMMPYHV